MDKAIAHLNIEHYRALLATEKGEIKRRMILRLLDEEAARLKALEDDPRRDDPPATGK
jgi:hypothetical protein